MKGSVWETHKHRGELEHIENNEMRAEYALMM